MIAMIAVNGHARKTLRNLCLHKHHQRILSGSPNWTFCLSIAKDRILRPCGRFSARFWKTTCHPNSSNNWKFQVGGFNPPKKILVKLDHFPKVRGEHQKIFETTQISASESLVIFVPGTFEARSWDDTTWWELSNEHILIWSRRQNSG